jgi:hypothetical protein
LRRKAQEHSAALLHSLQAAAAAGLHFPGLHLPPLSLHSALSSNRKASDFISDLSRQHHHNMNNNNHHSHNHNHNHSVNSSTGGERSSPGHKITNGVAEDKNQSD